MRRILEVGEGRPLPNLQGEVRHVPTLDAAIEAAAASDVVLWRSQNPDADVHAVARLVSQAPIIVIGPEGDVVLATEVLLAGAEDYVEEPAIDHATLHLAIECAITRARRRQDHEAAREAAFQAAVHERESALRRSLIDHLADRLHNPLTILTLQTSILAHRLPEAERHRVQQVQRATRRMRAIIDDISAAYRAETVDVGDIQPIELGAVLRSCLEGEDERVRSTKWGVRAEPAWIRSDPHLVRQIVWHLIEHASVATPPGERAAVDVDADNDGATIRVHVTSPPARQAFEPFAGLDDLATEGGLGLELYVARRMARRIGGDVVIQSDPDGCTVVMRLPAAARLQPSAA